MSDKPEKVAQPPERLSLSRWSRRKLEAARAATPPADVPQRPVAAPPQQPVQAAVPAPQNTVAPLPPIESLTIDSEFAAFFKPEVAEATKRAALKQLFRDPRFNIMDGLDVYIDDYTQPDPIPAEMMKQLLHTRHIFDPPATEVNADGHVVDIAPALPGETAATTAAVGVTPIAPEAPASAAESPAKVSDADAGKPRSDPTPA